MLAKQSVDHALMRAKSYAKKGEIGEAKKLYLSILKTFSKNKRAEQGLASLDKYRQNNTFQNLPQKVLNDLIKLYNQRKFLFVINKSEALTKQYPGAFFLWNILGASATQARMYDKALKAFKKSITLKPNNAEAYSNLGVVLKNIGNLDKAVEAYKKGISINPNYVDAYYNLGNILKDQGKLDEAIVAYKQSILLNPAYAEAYCNKGVALKNLGKFSEAIEAFKKSISIKPDNSLAYSNIGSILQDLGKLDEATISHQRSISFKPDNADAHLSLSFIFLSCGKLKEGLDEYEWRWKTDEYLSKYRQFSQPLWEREKSLKDKRILIWSEQGVGDTINWSSYIPFVVSQAKHCVLECQEKLVPLLKRSFPNIEVKAENRAMDLKREDIDFHLPMGNLYKNFINEILISNKADAHLFPDPVRITIWKERLKSLGKGPYIGICWKSILMTPERLPNYALISEWSPIFTIPNVKFINLQPNDFEADLKKIKSDFGVKVHNFNDLDHLNDLDDVAALCAALDLVVSNKTSVPLISAGVGTPTKLANWRQSSWNNPLLNPRGSSVDIYERDTWDSWENVFQLIKEDILKQNKNWSN